ncbi:hypothetical protein [Marinobacter shengliensis]|jgi:uncharacterized protein (TIGR00725 family)|uniref:SLOG cluster 4 domain-containing protein n=1 Tax=Marinobacter shengliensis TaxID=1389223 RepID=UPI001E425A0C|nr:hypothetical protein [Marinobacter shengliensis]MCD1632104.1 TIGR00725 family protein [Marinobacter shengliensis]
MVSRRKTNISVLGSYSASKEEMALAYSLGKSLANFPFNIISGGQKGVMLDLCRGAYEHRTYDEGCACTIVGILPYSDFEKANPYIDIVIPSGSAALQNILVPASGDLVIAIGGSAGTLAEISFAWQRGKKIALIGETGWAKKLAFTRLDDRRKDSLPHFENVEDVISWIKSELVEIKPLI